MLLRMLIFQRKRSSDDPSAGSYIMCIPYRISFKYPCMYRWMFLRNLTNAMYVVLYMCGGSIFTFLSAQVFVLILLSVSSGWDKLHCMHVTWQIVGKKKRNCAEIFGGKYRKWVDTLDYADISTVLKQNWR